MITYTHPIASNLPINPLVVWWLHKQTHALALTVSCICTVIHMYKYNVILSHTHTHTHTHTHIHFTFTQTHTCTHWYTHTHTLTVPSQPSMPTPRTPSTPSTPSTPGSPLKPPNIAALSTLQRKKLDFSTKLKNFKIMMTRLGFSQGSRLKFNIRRDHLLEDAYEHVMKSNLKHLQMKRLNISFKGEEGWVCSRIYIHVTYIYMVNWFGKSQMF